MLILLVCMVISGKMSLEKNVRQEYVAFNISVRKTKLLEHTVRKLNNSEAGGGPTTNYEKAFADIGSALELLEGFSGGSVVQSAEFFDSVSRGFRSSDVVELHSLTRDTQYKEQIIGATTLIRESVKILSRRTSIDKVVFRDTPSTRREARRDFIEYMNHILNQNSTPNQLNKEWTLMTGGKVTLNATSSYMGDITAKAYGMLQVSYAGLASGTWSQ
ncbi:Calcium/calmodulin-dependent 3',5'-cyclic nucleotide phosphodiesterase 1B [Perkinsus olseni]|uniref:Calcium/calmodulin-dependent 3',5'-cyclic nucleotide phosphodiesterase 1B n=1 Tax=Perkinsus olseni TaxID=32597 RepID=A0A7J6ST96_PEROL|nr:Calcium/calmodulin-dependent 3',5'-cyclic nucleotide phosphodiesterase 1B [Perkinsus olseni]